MMETAAVRVRSPTFSQIRLKMNSCGKSKKGNEAGRNLDELSGVPMAEWDMKTYLLYFFICFVLNSNISTI